MANTTKAHPREVKELAQSLYIQGFLPDAISTKLGVKKPTIHTWIKRGNWIALKAKTYNECGESDISKQIHAKSLETKRQIADELALVMDTLQGINLSPKMESILQRSNALQTLVNTADKLFQWSRESASQTIASIDLLADMEKHAYSPEQQEHTKTGGTPLLVGSGNNEYTKKDNSPIEVSATAIGDDRSEEVG